jgi:hypothetical protein
LQLPRCLSGDPVNRAYNSALPAGLRFFYHYGGKREFGNDTTAFVGSAFWTIDVFD